MKAKMLGLDLVQCIADLVLEKVSDTDVVGIISTGINDKQEILFNVYISTYWRALDAEKCRYYLTLMWPRIIHPLLYSQVNFTVDTINGHWLVIPIQEF